MIDFASPELAQGLYNGAMLGLGLWAGVGFVHALAKFIGLIRRAYRDD